MHDRTEYLDSERASFRFRLLMVIARLLWPRTLLRLRIDTVKIGKPGMPRTEVPGPYLCTHDECAGVTYCKRKERPDAQ